MPQKQENSLLVALLMLGLLTTLFGTIIVALPMWVLDNLFATSDCGDRCVPSTPPEHTATVHPLTVVIASMIFGFLPLLIYLIIKFCRRNYKEEPPMQSDHPNELR